MLSGQATDAELIQTVESEDLETQDGEQANEPVRSIDASKARGGGNPHGKKH